MANAALDYFKLAAHLKDLNEYSNLEFYIDIEGRYSTKPTLYINVRYIRYFNVPKGFVWRYSEKDQSTILQRCVEQKAETVLFVKDLEEFKRVVKQEEV